MYSDFHILGIMFSGERYIANVILMVCKTPARNSVAPRAWDAPGPAYLVAYTSETFTVIVFTTAWVCIACACSRTPDTSIPSDQKSAVSALPHWSGYYKRFTLVLLATHSRAHSKFLKFADGVQSVFFEVFFTISTIYSAIWPSTVPVPYTGGYHCSIHLVQEFRPGL